MKHSHGISQGPVSLKDEDWLDMWEHARKLCALFDSLSDGTVIAIYGDWGCGKTSYLRMLQRQLTGTPWQPIWADLWQYEKHQDIGYALSRDIMLASDSLLENCLRKGAVVADSAFAALSIISRALNLELPGVKIAVPEKTEELNKVQEEIDKEHFTHFTDAEKSVQKLKRRLSAGDNKILFFDDLDRVSPELGLQILEEIKILLGPDPFRDSLPGEDAGNPAAKHLYVLAVDARTMKEAVFSRYNKQGFQNSRELSQCYLDKLIDIFIPVPTMSVESAYKYIANMIQQYKLPRLSDAEQYLILLGAPLNPRALKRLLTVWYFEKALPSNGNKLLALRNLILKHSFGEIWNLVKWDASLHDGLQSADVTIPRSLAECTEMRATALKHYEILMNKAYAPSKATKALCNKLLKGRVHLLCLLRLSLNMTEEAGHA